MNDYIQRIIEEIENNKEKYISISKQIHANPELGNEEYFASQILSDCLLENSFEVQKGVAGHKTGFIAKSGTSGPKVAFLAEYDALEKLGHACGHNLIGTISTLAAIALSNVVKENVQVYVYGSPAEEGGVNGSAKATYVKEGLFNDIDFALMVHPSGEDALTANTLAVDPIDIEFFGRPAHAASAPYEGINALDSQITLFNNIGLLRQQLTNDVKIHGIITDGGDAPNIIPEYTKSRFYIRSNSRLTLNEVTKKIKNIAKGSALATGCEYKVTHIQNGVDEFVINKSFNEVYQETFEQLTSKKITFAKKGIGSTDAGNVSQVIPTIHPTIKIGSKDLIGHTEEFCKAANSIQAQEAIVLGAKTLAITALKVATNSELLEKIKKEDCLNY